MRAIGLLTVNAEISVRRETFLIFLNNVGVVIIKGYAD